MRRFTTNVDVTASVTLGLVRDLYWPDVDVWPAKAPGTVQIPHRAGTPVTGVGDGL